MAPQPNQGQPAQQQPGEGAGTEAEGDALDELENALAAEGDGTQGAEQGTDEWKPPSREEWEAQKASLEAERAKLERARKQAQRLREKSKGQPTLPAEGTEGEAAQPTGPDPQVTVWQQRAVRSSAKVALLDRGADPEMVDLLVTQLRVDQVDFNDDDEPELDEWLDRMEDKHPKVFTKGQPAPQQPGTRRPMGGVDQGSGQGRPPARQMSLGQKILANSEKAMRTRGGRG